MGFLWFGTKDGLNRFDGYTFKTYRNDPRVAGSIGSNFIHSLHEDKEGVLWVGTEKGLYSYNAALDRFTELPATKNLPVTEIATDGKGDLWLISGFTLFQYSQKQNRLISFTPEQYFEATALCITPNGTVWVATSQGLLQQYNPGTNSFSAIDLFRHSPPNPFRWIERLYCTTNGNLLVGTGNAGAKLFEPQTGEYKDIPLDKKEQTGLFVRNFIQTESGEYWIGTESGIYIYSPQTGTTTNLRKQYNNPFSLSDNAVYTFCQDREGGIWAGTYFGGINYYPKQYTPFKQLVPRSGENSLSGNVVREIRQDQQGNLWIGTEDAGLNKLNPHTGVFTRFEPSNAPGSLSYFNIHGLLVDGNKLWMGTFEHGLDVLDIKLGKVVQHYATSNQPELKSNFIYCIYKAPDGTIMIGTTIGAYRYNRHTNRFTPLSNMPVYNWYTSLFQDAEGIIWAGTYGNGIHFYNTRTGASGNFSYHAADKNSLSNDRINSIFEDSNKNLWFATEDGLCQFNKEKNNFTRYTTVNGLPSNFTLSILEDEQQNLWVSTTRGLVRFTPRTGKMAVFTIANGLLSNQFNFSSAFKDNTGRMYFGTAKGLVSFHPGEFTRNHFMPPVYITGFQIDNKEVPIGVDGSPLEKSIAVSNKITLRHNQSTFSIDFAALSFTAPEMVAYAYKMNGLNKDWVYLKTNRKVYFTKLSPGTYTFQVKAANSSGLWSKQESRLVIEIMPPWWASSWAYAGYFILAVMLVYMLIRNYHQRVEERNRRKIELLEIAKEKEIYEAKMEFFTNVAHEIRTPLTLIKGPLEKVLHKATAMPELNNSLKIMERNTNRLIDLTNQLLDFRQTEIHGFSLNFTRANISELLQEIYTSFTPLAEQKSVHFTLHVPSAAQYASVDVEAFSKILYNLLGNAVKYAHKKVSVHLLPFLEDDRSFSIEVKNDGILIPEQMRQKIFEPFFRLKETERQKGTGIGLALSRSLVLLHKGALTLKEPEGDCNVFLLTLPVRQDLDSTLTDPVTNRNFVAAEQNNV